VAHTDLELLLAGRGNSPDTESV